jgi:hypothetical protein
MAPNFLIKAPLKKEKDLENLIYLFITFTILYPQGRYFKVDTLREGYRYLQIGIQILTLRETYTYLKGDRYRYRYI